ncbi:MAG: glycosyltransferase family 4 protein [Chryseolinea sp.]
MRKDFKFVFVSHGNSNHGAELCLVETVKSLTMQGFINIYVLLSPGGNYLENLLLESGAKIEHINENPRWVYKRLNFRQKISWVKRSISSFIQFFKIFSKLRPEYVITNSIVCNPASALAAKLRGATHAWYIHELGDLDHNYEYYLGKKLTWAIVKLLSDKVILNSYFTLRHFTNEPIQDRNKFKVIYYGVPIERFEDESDGFKQACLKKWDQLDTWNILVSGRTVEGKGQEDIIHALGILKRHDSNARFKLTILGMVPGTYYSKLVELVEHYALGDCVSIFPFSEHPGSYYRDAHIGVTTSRHEAFGRITVEYMKSNMAVVGANAGGTTEILEPNVDGYLYTLGNNSEFAMILLAIMADSEKARKMAAAAQANSEIRFNLAIHGSRIAEFLITHRPKANYLDIRHENS